MSLLTTDELADRWRCGSTAVADAIRAGELRAAKIAGRWLVTEDDAAAYESARVNIAPAVKRARRPRARRAS
jgi:excisionase family DNA binding protein